jgi:hypothetical protein
MSLKHFVAAGLAVAGTLGAGLAQARSDVHWSVSIGLPGIVVGGPAYLGAPVYAPAPLYSAPPVVYEPAPVYVPAPAYGYGYGASYARPYRHVRHYSGPTRGDADGDGIPNRYDRVYNPRWDRNGDGIADRSEHRGWRR